VMVLYDIRSPFRSGSDFRHSDPDEWNGSAAQRLCVIPLVVRSPDPEDGKNLGSWARVRVGTDYGIPVG
jgi:hypothetical protein